MIGVIVNRSRYSTYFSGNVSVRTVLVSYNYIDGPYVQTNLLFVFLEDFVCTITAFLEMR